MTYLLSDLLSSKAIPKGEGQFSVAEMFYDPETWALRYVALDAGGWFDRREVLIGIAHFGAAENGTWPVDMSREGVDGAPQWDEAPRSLVDMPPVVVGPFGYTFSPLLMAAQWHEAGETVPDDPTDPPRGETERKIARLERARFLMGREVFGPEGFTGEIADMRVSTDWTMTAMVLTNAEVIPLTRLHRIAEQGHIITE